MTTNTGLWTNDSLALLLQFERFLPILMRSTNCPLLSRMLNRCMVCSVGRLVQLDLATDGTGREIDGVNIGKEASWVGLDLGEGKSFRRVSCRGRGGRQVSSDCVFPSFCAIEVRCTYCRWPRLRSQKVPGDNRTKSSIPVRSRASRPWGWGRRS
jgi:hypothetical protein